MCYQERSEKTQGNWRNKCTLMSRERVQKIRVGGDLIPDGNSLSRINHHQQITFEFCYLILQTFDFILLLYIRLVRCG